MEQQESPPDVTTDLPRIGGPYSSETELYLAERWETDAHSVTRCGDLLIGRDPDDPFWFVVEACPGQTAGYWNGSKPYRIIRERFPLEGIDCADGPRHLYALIAYRFGDFANPEPPRDGLEEWYRAAEPYVLETLEAAREAAEREALELAATLPRTAAQLLTETPVEPEWIIPGVLARRWTVKVAGREKTGKGTLVFYLLGKLEQGAAECVFGKLPERPISSLIYTEEPEESVREKVEAFGLRRARVAYGWELAALSWEETVTTLIGWAVHCGCEILFVDNISRAAGIEEESGTELARATEYLITRAQDAGLAVILDHHHKKGKDSLENKSRGGTALAGAVDVNVELVRIGDWESRKRKLSARGRMRATVWERTVELTEDGHDFELVEDVAGAVSPEIADFAREYGERMADRERLREMGGKATVKEFAEALGGVSLPTARTRLDNLVGHGIADVEKGRGKASVYWLITGEAENAQP